MLAVGSKPWHTIAVCRACVFCMVRLRGELDITTFGHFEYTNSCQTTCTSSCS